MIVMAPGSDAAPAESNVVTSKPAVGSDAAEIFVALVTAAVAATTPPTADPPVDGALTIADGPAPGTIAGEAPGTAGDNITGDDSIGDDTGHDSTGHDSTGHDQGDWPAAATTLIAATMPAPLLAAVPALPTRDAVDAAPSSPRQPRDAAAVAATPLAPASMTDVEANVDAAAASDPAQPPRVADVLTSPVAGETGHAGAEPQPSPVAAPSLDAHAPSATAPRATGGETPPAGLRDTARDPASPAAEPWLQVARAVQGIRRLPDGSQRLTLRLDPPELGSIRLDVTVRDGRLDLRAVTNTAAAHHELTRALPELRASIVTSGLSAGSFEVGVGSGQAGSDSSSHTRPDAVATLAPRPRDTPEAPPTAATPGAPAPIAGRLDLRL